MSRQFLQGDIVELNTGALIASPDLTSNWISARVHRVNNIGQVYVLPAGNSRFSPMFVFPKYLRKAEVLDGDLEKQLP